MNNKEILAKAGTLQTLSMIVFCLAALLGTFAFIRGSYGLAIINGCLMAGNFALYQMQSAIIRNHLPRR